MINNKITECKQKKNCRFNLEGYGDGDNENF